VAMLGTAERTSVAIHALQQHGHEIDGAAIANIVSDWIHGLRDKPLPLLALASAQSSWAGKFSCLTVGREVLA
jgi:hypothetical protein